VEAFWQTVPHCPVVWLHPELLKEVDVVLALGHFLGDGLHSLRLVQAAELCGHTPCVERHDFEWNTI